jgi:glycosyltransferase involved in cell wall biosynthesis
MGRILLLAPDVPPAPGVLAAGPGIRYAELAAVLRAAGLEVTLASPEAASTADAVWQAERLGELLPGHDAVVLPQSHVELGRQLARHAPRELPVVVDLYAPLLVENLALAHAPADVPGFRWLRRRALDLLQRGDLFLVANERQRLYALGLLSALGRLGPLTYERPPLLQIPYGVPADPPRPPGRVVARGVLVPQDAPLAVWYGGVYPWFDAETAVRGFARALDQVPEAWLAIVGGRHPRAHAPDGELLRALAAARTLGVAERVVEAPWGPYEERTAWYAEADCAICLHHPGPETDLAHRTRLVDLIWGRVPFVCSQGDAVGEQAAAAGAAIAVPPHDADAAGVALAALLSDADGRAARREAAAELAGQLAWPTVLGPLVDWLRDPSIAADRFAATSWRPALTALARAAWDSRYLPSRRSSRKVP